LINPAHVPEGVKITEENYEAFVPAAHKKLVDVMKA
jgi:hypothetical protein